jgi:hypothetical protein
MPATPLRAQLSNEELLCHEHARSTRPPHPVRPGQHREGVAVAICEIEAGLRSASQLERICPHRLWDAVPRPVRVPRPTGHPT